MVKIEVNQVNIDTTNIYNRTYSGSINLNTLDLRNSKLSLYESRISNVNEIEISFSERSTDTVKNIKKDSIISYSGKYKVKFKFDLDEIEEYNKKVIKFYQDYGGLNFNLDKLIRETKVEFNKNIIKSKGGNFKEKLNQVFNINL